MERKEPRSFCVKICPMAYALTIDTHKFIKRLETKGFTSQQAEAIVENIAEMDRERANELATKQDIVLLQRDIKEMDLKIESLRKDLIIEINKQGWKMFGYTVTVLTILMALFKFFH